MRTTLLLLLSVLLTTSSLSAQDCQISGLTATVSSCTNGQFYVLLNFEHTGPISNGFHVQGNGTNYGNFLYNQLPLTLGPLAANGTTSYEFVVNDVTFPDCHASTILGPVTCSPPPACEIYDFTVETGDCHPNESTYDVTINFSVSNPATTNFKVWGNNQLLGTYSLSSLPLTINNFPYNGGPNDVIKVCINDSNCCKEEEFPAPTPCFLPCAISGLTVQTGECHPNSNTYNVTIDFDVANAPTPNFKVYGNGTLLGTYSIVNLPLTINNFPYNGGPNDVLQVCMNDTPDCCATKEFPVPACTQQQTCAVSGLTVQTGECHPNSNTYNVTIDFDVVNPPTTNFKVYGNGTLLGTFPLSSLPLTINNFPYNGGPNDVLQVCINDAPDCCATKEFPVPDCAQQQACAISNLTVQTGDCNVPDSIYQITVDFDVVNPTISEFKLWSNGVLVGTYGLNSLPLTLPVVYNGGPNDVIQVCIFNNPQCCAVLEYPVPDCFQTSAPCEVYNLTVLTGDCDVADSTYTVTINFQVQNSPNALFDVWANNGVYLGTFPLNSLPLTINDFPYNGGANDVIKICINDAPNCCRVKEFPVPDCFQTSGPCEVYNLTVQTGDCHVADSTYSVTINFQVQNSPNTLFDVWGNGVYLGYYSLMSLPLTINNFPYNGGPNDVIKICINDAPNCCRVLEFPAPDCFQGGACEIYNLTVQTGDCHPDQDSTYTLVLDFDVANPSANTFGVWANNGVYLGTFPLSSLPLTIPYFPYNGGLNDVVKVCISEDPGCCRVKEFPVPDCYSSTGDCHIWNVQVQHTPCLCGQFFALVTFNHANGSDGFDIVGNGTNYGTWPYSAQQPIILGPLNTGTGYEFNVRDHANHDCHQGVDLAPVNCLSSTGGDGFSAAGTPKLTLSPNPAQDHLTASTLWPGLSNLGAANVEIRQADGRLVRSLTVAEGSQFSLDTSSLAAGTYSVAVQTAVGRVIGSFVKL